MIYEIIKLNEHDMILGYDHVATRDEFIAVVYKYSADPKATKITVKKWKSKILPKSKK